jgi:hypothetical protein
MPPRYAYWTILIDDKPTAFRAREKAELVPTFHQLQRTNPNIVFRWFARGRLWETPEQARDALRRPRPPREPRGRDWRPGGEHKDPRARFKARKKGTGPPRRGGRPRPSGKPPRRG